MLEPDIENVQYELEVAAAPVAPVVAAAAAPSNPILDSMHWNEDLAAVLHRDPTLLQTAWTSFFAARAPGTVKCYTNLTMKFQQFCVDHDLSFPLYSSDTLLQFILHHIKNHASFSFLASIKPALALLDAATHRPSPFNKYIDTVLAGAKRQRRAARGPVRKATPVPLDQIKLVLDTYVTPNIAHPELIPAVRFRTAFRVLVEYHTCCRFSCFAKLQARHFERVGPDIVITFPSAKNDQLHEGRTSVLAANGSLYCPARLAIAYFRCFGLRFGHAANDTSFVNFQLRRAAGSLRPIPHRSLSYTGATEDLRETLAAVGVDPTGTSDKSIKMAGVTAAYQAGATSEEVMHLGRWKTLSVPLQYKINSFAFKKRIAEKVPALDADANA
jgi:hypothetical protein